jgi:hypothetical protein
MTDLANKKFSLETSCESFAGKEELIKNILIKFEALLNKEEYYNFQERVYKLNKMLNSVNRQTNSVSHFEDVEGISSSFIEHSSTNNHKILSLESLSEILDDLLKNKESMDKRYICLTTSSSEDDDMQSKFPVRVEKRKSFLRNLYNYELFLKTYLYEKSVSQEKQCEDNTHVAMTNLNTVESSNLSINNMTMTSTKPMEVEVESSLLHTPSSSKTDNNPGSNKTLNLTPLIKKSFFEDLEVHKIKENRRRSMIEESKSGLAAIQVSKRMSGIFQSQILNSYSHKETRLGESNEKKQCEVDSKCQISQFLTINTNPQVNSMQPLPKRSSIFTNKEELLSNIGENDEYYSQLSIEGSLKSEEDCDK